VVKDPQAPNKNKGFGFVCFEKIEDAERAQKGMHDKAVMLDSPALYVSFAMKKEERKEHLQKKREELIRQSQKMTVFSKMKEDSNIVTYIRIKPSETKTTS